MRRSFPVRFGAKPVVLVSLLILSGCGGGGASESSTQTVQGAGYRFEAPAGWTVTHARDLAAAASGGVNLVEVRTFELERPYDAKRFAAATRELDSVISRLAAQLRGQVTNRRTVVVDGRRSRSYVISYDGKTQQITFVLVGRQEHQLLCRRSADGNDAPCADLLASFVLR
jgi:hypothetical protein